MESAKLNVLRETVEPCRVKLSVEAPAERSRQAYQAAVVEFRKHAKIDGFRPGKTPPALVLRQFGPKIREDACGRLVRELVDEAVKQEKLTPETRPAIENQDKLVFAEDAPFSFKVTFDIAPEFSMPPYKGLPLARPASAVTEASVAKTIASLLERRTTYETVARPAQEGDLLKANLSGRLADGGDLSEDAKFLLNATDRWLPLRVPEMIPGANAALAGLAAGQEKEFESVFPADYFEKSLAGKTVLVKVQIVEVQASLVPELTDELAKQMGAETAEELKTRIKGMMSAEDDRRRDLALREQAVQKLMAVPDFPLPPALLYRETVDAYMRLYEAAMRGGKKEEEVAKDKDKNLEQARATASVSLKRHYLFEAIAKAEKIDVAAAEMDGAIKSVATANQMTDKNVQRRLMENGRLDDLYCELRDRKTVERVVALAQISDAPAA